MVVGSVKFLEVKQRFQRTQIVNTVMTDVQSDKGIKNADRVQMNDLILGETQLSDRSQFPDAEVLNVIKLWQVEIAKDEALDFFNPVSGVPEHGALEDEASLKNERCGALTLE